jgi:hypothetical protein
MLPREKNHWAACKPHWAWIYQDAKINGKKVQTLYRNKNILF